ncbi:MAG: HEPN domain-containing protein [Candidatus Thermoplasmatota archaeon]|nr:HEPN domain-containing protein [Candidatus Thermoplasmatota archaeon]
MDEIHFLIEKAYSRLEVARELFENDHFEESISRSYFAMVSAASAALQIKHLTTKTHRGLQMRFQEEFIRSGEIEEEMGRIFRFSEDMRNRADYQTFVNISREQADTVLEDAERFISNINALVENIE